jgi:hypothetical protein
MALRLSQYENRLAWQLHKGCKRGLLFVVRKPWGAHPFDRVCAARHRPLPRVTLPAADQRHRRALQPPLRRASCPDAAKPRRPPPPLSQPCRNGMPTSRPSSPTTIAPVCDVSTSKLLPNSSLNLWGTTPFVRAGYERCRQIRLADPPHQRQLFKTGAVGPIRAAHIAAAPTDRFGRDRRVSWTPKMRQLAKVEPCP